MTTSDELVSRLLSAIERLEQCATAAGHGFGHLPLSHELNAGWTQLDLTDNVRPTYDQNFARAFAPDSVLRLCRAHRKLVDEWRKQQTIRDVLADDPDATDDAYLTAAGITAGLWAAVTLVAEGYGLREENSDGQ